MATPLHNAPAVATGLAIGADSSGSSLCVLCADFERQVLNPLTQENEVAIVKHHGSFELLVAAAAGGCRLCCALKEGYLRRNLLVEPSDEAELQALMDQAFLRLLGNDQERESPRRQWTLRNVEEYNKKTQEVDPGFELLLVRAGILGPQMTTTDSQPWPGYTHLEFRRRDLYSADNEDGACFMLCTDRGSTALLEGYFGGREIPQHFDATIAKDWLDTCLQSHTCGSTTTASSSGLPTRLVRIDGYTSDLKARLVVTDESIKDEQYAALSYRWSKKKEHLTLTQYVQAYTNNIPLDTLPATIQDAIRITHALGIRYVWIDCLCIIQDSLRDWELECGRMSNIFANATMTIAASSGTDAEYGLLRLRNASSNTSHCNLTFRDANGIPCGAVKVVHIKDLSMLNGAPHVASRDLSPLDQRGWTLQERLLSTRVLSFEDDRTWWECASCRMVEALHPCIQSSTNTRYGLDKAKEPLLKFTSAQIYDWWLLALEEFSKRQLTYGEDLLPAVAGLASVVSRVTTDTYLAGLWQQDLGRGLLWNCEGFPSRSQIPDLTAPSWSWARSENKVWHETSDLSDFKSTVAFVSADIKTAGANLFGRVLPGSVLTIRAPTRPALIHWELYDDRVRCFIPTAQPGEVRISLDSDIACRTNVLDTQKSLLAMKVASFFYEIAPGMLKKTSGLLLQLTSDGTNYRRIGTIDASPLRNLDGGPEAVDHFYSDAETKTISII